MTNSRSFPSQIWYKCSKPHVKIVHYLLYISGTDVAKLVKYGGELELKCTSVITWALFMYCVIARRELIYAGFQNLCIIYLITNIKNDILQLVIFFSY